MSGRRYVPSLVELPDQPIATYDKYMFGRGLLWR